jgi:phosphoesterase family protein/ASPM-SPD-2-Hydin domain-containing protein
MPDPRLAAGVIEHIVVLVMENRSFDHMLGYLKAENPELDGVPGDGAFANQYAGRSYPVRGDATPVTPLDPRHELHEFDVQMHSEAAIRQQLLRNPSDREFVLDGIDMSGFVRSASRQVLDSGIDPGFVMRCQAPTSVPVLAALAREYAVCDRWFSSLPGPTIPNRLFIHAGSSAGYAKSPDATLAAIGAGLGGAIVDRIKHQAIVVGISLAIGGLLGAITTAIASHLGGSRSYADAVDDVIGHMANFEAKQLMGVPVPTFGDTIYDRLERSLPNPVNAWRIYFHDLSEVLLFPTLRRRFLDELHSGKLETAQGNFNTIDRFAEHAAAGNLPRYSFICPRSNTSPRFEDIAPGLRRVLDQLASGNSDIIATLQNISSIGDEISQITGAKSLPPNDQHPAHDVRDGEELIARVYDALRESPVWDRTMLILTYDEAGGFFDHVVPPVGVVSPGGHRYPENVAPSPDDPRFGFNALGPRVPALVVSPRTARGRVDHTPRDHTSILATAARLFSLPGRPDNEREDAAADLLALATEVPPRSDTIRHLYWPAIPLGIDAIEPVAVVTHTGALEVFFTGVDRHLYHKWYTSNGGWLVLEDTGYTVQGAPAAVAAAPATTQPDPARTDWFALLDAATLVHGTGWVGTTGDSGGNLRKLTVENLSLPGAGFASPPSTARSGDRLALVVRSDRGALVRNLATAVSRSDQSTTQWDGWAEIDSSTPSVGAVALVADPAVAGRFDVFARSAAGELLHASWADRGALSPWANLGRPATDRGAQPLTGTPGGGTARRGLHAFCRAADGRLWVRWQPPHNPDWAPWEDWGGALGDAPVGFARPGDGLLGSLVEGFDLFARLPNGRVGRRFHITSSALDLPPPVIAVHPGSIDFGTVTAGTRADRDLALSNSGTGPLNAALSVSGAGFTVEPAQLAVAASGTAHVTVQFTPSRAARCRARCTSRATSRYIPGSTSH